MKPKLIFRNRHTNVLADGGSYYVSSHGTVCLVDEDENDEGDLEQCVYDEDDVEAFILVDGVEYPVA